MNNSIDVLEILKKSSDFIGKDVYSPIFGWGKITKITDRVHVKFPKENNHKLFDRFGKFSSMGECVLFPDKNCNVSDWIKYRFQDGDFIIDNNTICIFKSINGSEYSVHAGIDSGDNLRCYTESWGTTEHLFSARLASDEEKQELLNRLFDEKRYGWDDNVKVIFPQFVSGDYVKTRYSSNGIGIVRDVVMGKILFSVYREVSSGIQSDLIEYNFYHNHKPSNMAYEFRLATKSEIDDLDTSLQQNNIEVRSSDKFNPLTLKPFDKVLVRPDNSDVWECDFFSSYNPKSTNPYHCVSMWTDQCIPFNEDTKHLAGKVDNPINYYVTWENK